MTTAIVPEPSEATRVDTIDDLVAEYLRHHAEGDVERIRRAHDVAERAHRGQTRRSGEDYITHPVAVAGVLAGYGLDADTVVAALLHDTVEDTELSLEAIEDDFGAEVARLIDGVTKLDRIRFDSREEAQAATIRKMVVAMAQDVRVILIKLADRLHNVRTLGVMPRPRQEHIAAETLDVYVPLAHRLGAQDIKHELEDRCFQVLHPGPYAEISQLIAERAPQREAVVAAAIEGLEARLERAGIRAEVTGRPKHHYSIWRKMVESGQGFEHIYDLIGVRVVVADVPACYASLGEIHTLWTPLTGRFKDYVAMPKFNLYQSLHTTVLGPDNKPLEVQVRSWDMHQRAEYGIAAHWRYKEGAAAEDVPWLADLRVLQEESTDPQQFLESLKLDLYRDEVFVATPAGDVKTLPVGATPVDFAYAVHTEVGHRCVGAKVNGRLVPLDTTLSSGDVVEILTSKRNDAGPSRDWTRFVSSSRARSRIKQWFQQERREVAIAEGRDRVFDLLRREGLGLTPTRRDTVLTEVAGDLGHRSLDALFAAVGEGGISPAMVVTRVLREVRPDATTHSPEDFLTPPPPVRRRATDGPGVEVDGFDGVLVRLARCCAPVPGDSVVGFVTVGRGVSVHRSDCVNIGGFEGSRMVDVNWSDDVAGQFSVWIEVEALDRTGLLRDVTNAISDMGAYILASSSATDSDRIAWLRYEVQLSEPEQIARLLTEVRRVTGVYDTHRMVPSR